MWQELLPQLPRTRQGPTAPALGLPGRGQAPSLGGPQGLLRHPPISPSSASQARKQRLALVSQTQTWPALEPQYSRGSAP